MRIFYFGPNKRIGCGSACYGNVQSNGGQTYDENARSSSICDFLVEHVHVRDKVNSRRSERQTFGRLRAMNGSSRNQPTMFARPSGYPNQRPTMDRSRHSLQKKPYDLITSLEAALK